MDSGLKLWGIMTATAIVLPNESPTLVKVAARLAKVVFGNRIQICNGANDEVEIQAAIDALSARGGKVILLEGIFYIYSSIELRGDLVIAGQGVKATTLTLMANADCDIFAYTSGTATNFLVIEDMYLYGNGDNNAAGRGIYLNPNIVDVWISRIFVNKTAGHGIEIDNAWFAVITGVIVEYCLGDGLKLGGSSAKIVATKIGENVGYGIWGYLSYTLITGTEIFGNGKHGLYLLGGVTKGWNVVTCCNFRGNGAVTATQTEIWIDSSNDIISSNTINCLSVSSWGVYVTAAQTGTYIFGNIIMDYLMSAIADDSKVTRYTDQHSDPFMDVLAASANYIVNAQNLVNGAVALTGTQPKYPRGLDCTITNVAGAVSAYTMTVVGVNGKGIPITEVFTFDDDGLVFSSDNAFDHVTSVTLADVVDTGNATFVMGIDGRLGLMNVIYVTSDVWKIIKNGAKQAVVGAQVDVDYGTYDMAAAIGIALNDDFEIWYRSNLNLIS